MPSALFESGFINNPTESKKLAHPVYQDKLAQGIANGIETYLKDNIKLTGEPIIPEEPNPPGEPEIPDENESVIKTGETTASNLNVSSGETTPPPTDVIKKGKVSASKLNVRSGYGTSNTVIGSLSRGAEVEIVESKNDWHKIKFNNTYGCVSGEYISII